MSKKPVSRKPVLIELDETPQLTPAEAAPVPELAAPQGAAMQAAITLGARKPSRLMRWFFSLLGALLVAAVSVAAWDFAFGLIARAPVLGYFVTALIVALLLVLLFMALRELAAFARLRRLDGVKLAAEQALATGELPQALAAMRQLTKLYASRDEMTWALARYEERAGEAVDADTLLSLGERELMAPLDALAVQKVEAAARQVATVTAIVPLAFADVIAALTANTRMIRAIAEVYGGRAGALGNWRLVKAVMTHLVATGAVAVGDDMLGSLAGGGVLGKLSRRFGEGVINGALTARVGVAAIEVCRPMAFSTEPRPAVTSLVGRALKGLFGSKSG
ncbi:YcjF family protein [Lentibacter algarum]|uniref:YcjF family protein n=1 Tax=Lentibacter algarum TaxID=576131 RepID=UPI001C0735EF|nr:TIGR01620 family protein [Lentibacter algarum]MBU2980999.1 YcjF family protein [Lentibacter algarum]